MDQWVVVCMLKYLRFLFPHWHNFQELLEVPWSLEYGYAKEQLI